MVGSVLGRSAPAAALAIGLAAGPASLVRAQAPDDRPAVRRALAMLERDNEWTLSRQAALCRIPAPPFGEAARGRAMVRELRALGFARPTTDSVGNVIAVRRGAGRGPRLVLSAHLDTVFPAGTDVTVTRRGTRLTGPGIGDDCRGLAVLLAVARAIAAADLPLAGDLILAATVGEEGAGNLRGVRALLRDRSLGRIDGFVSIDGIGFGLVGSAVGSNRYRVTFTGPGGHSYGDFGMPNPIHALGRAIAALADVTVPATPKTTFSVGVVSGGTSVNSIAGSASMDVDLRSESQTALERLDGELRAAVDRAVAAEKARWPESSVSLTAVWHEIGKRPAGTQPDSIWLIRAVRQADQTLGLGTTTVTAASTDANAAIGLGIPGITIDGGGRGDGAHSLGEWYDDADRGYLGAQRVLLLVVLGIGG